LELWDKKKEDLKETVEKFKELVAHNDELKK
jgi:hypothetical protein